jgi:hypothetical protein
MIRRCVLSYLTKTPVKKLSKISSMENTVATEQPVKDPTFSEWVQCDSCRVARATWKIIGDSGELFMCGHHKSRHEAGLTRWAKEFIELELKTSKS